MADTKGDGMNAVEVINECHKAVTFLAGAASAGCTTSEAVVAVARVMATADKLLESLRKAFAD